MQSNWNQPTYNVLRDLIVNSNPAFAATGNAYTFYSPTINTGSNASTHNSVMHIAPQASSNYTGELDVYFNRIQFDAYLEGKFGTATPFRSFGYGQFQTPITADSTADDLRVAINAVCGINQGPSDVSNYSFVVSSDGKTVSVTLTFSEDADLFLNTKTSLVTLDQTPPKIKTNTIITTSDLDGLVVPV